MGRNLNLFKPGNKLELRKHFYSERAVSDWNDLPNEVVNALAVGRFKEPLDRLWISEHHVFD